MVQILGTQMQSGFQAKLCSRAGPAYRRRQDFSLGCTLFFSQSWLPFSHRPQYATGYPHKLTSPILQPSPPSKILLKNLTSYSSWGFTYNLPLWIKLPIFFSPLGQVYPWLCLWTFNGLNGRRLARRRQGNERGEHPKVYAQAGDCTQRVSWWR